MDLRFSSKPNSVFTTSQTSSQTHKLSVNFHLSSNIFQSGPNRLPQIDVLPNKSMF